MTTYKLGLSANSKTAYIAHAEDTLPVGATNVLDNIIFGAEGDKVDENGDNHVLYHNVQEALYHEGIQDMQSVSIVKSGVVFASTGVTIVDIDDLDLSDEDTLLVDIEYLPGNETAPNASFDFESSTPAVATIDEDGLITAVGVGETTITVTHKVTGWSATAIATVVA